MWLSSTKPRGMTTQPVLLLTFSNHPDDYLPMIVAEQKAIKQALLDFDDKNYLQLRDLQHASTEEIFYLINRYHNRVCILHYGGHADGQSLQLEQDVGVVQAAAVQGIAGLLGTQQNLKLAFLNGCATRGQVQALLDKGVPAVIATRVSINDREAQLFATQFYEAMAGGSRLIDAFRKAKAMIETQRADIRIEDPDTTRGIVLPEADDDLPWGLYWRAEAAEVLDWKLPTAAHYEINLGAAQRPRREQRSINGLLVDPVLKAIRHSEVVIALARKIHQQRRAGDMHRQPTDAEKKDALIRAYPAPISVHLRALFSNSLSEKLNEARLQQLVNTYQISLQFSAFVLLSELWDQANQIAISLKMSEEEKLQLQAFFDVNAYTAPAFDYFLLVDALLRIGHRNQIDWYVEEWATYPNGWTDHPVLTAANEYFRLLITELETDIPSRLIETYNLDAEEQLTALLTELQFLVNYRMAVVKNIEVQQIKHLPPTAFRHVIVELDNSYQDIGEKDRQQQLERPTDMESVLLFREQLHESLNLSPFVLDENALTREYNSKIYFLAHRTADSLLYEWIENPADQLTVDSYNYGYILQQLARARQDLLGDRPQSASTGKTTDEDDILTLI